MEKIIKYIKYLGGELIAENERSHYYMLRKKIVRVSDHIGLNSSGNINIIVTPNGYLVWNRSSGDIDIVNYEDIKVLLKHINVLSAMTIDAERIDKLLNITGTTQQGDKTTILGYPTEKFSEGQIKQINEFIKQITNKKN